MSEDFFKSFFKGNIIIPPDNVRNTFFAKFPDAINVEWVKMDPLYEAIFYEHETEKIARYTDEGNWIDTKTNLDLIALRPEIRKNAEQSGEIMNSIEIETDGSVNYEVIVRDKSLNRFLLIMSSNGEINSNNPLD